MKGIVSCILPVLFTGCGLSIYEDWQASNDKAIIGGGAVAGKDYINGLLPSENSRKYFTQISADSDQPIETVSRTDDSSSKSGVRFVKNGGIVIPPGTTISYTNKGYCMDPNLPAPKSGEEFQLVPMAQLIPEELQGTYKKLLEKASSGDTSVQFNMQHLVLALRTAGTDAAYANNLTTQQKRILDRCSDYQGQFEDFHATAKSNSKMMKELLGLADSYLNVKIGGVSYKASDLLDPDIGSKKINEHLNQLIDMSKSLPVERSGFNYGELQKGIYTDVRGSGYLQYTAKIANSTNKEFIFYPQDYVGQVGSGTKTQGLTFFATAGNGQRQRCTQTIQNQIVVNDQRAPQTSGNRSFREDLTYRQKLRIYIFARIAKAAYADSVDSIPNGYRVITKSEFSSLISDAYLKSKFFTFDQNGYFFDSISGFSARLIKNKNTGELIISYRGTEPDDFGDVSADIAQFSGEVTTQHRNAARLLKNIIQNFDGNITVTGHSLGGGLVTYAMSMNNLENRVSGITFNSAGISQDVKNTFQTVNIESAQSSIINIRSNGDPVSAIPTTNHIGNMYDVDNSRFNDHGIDGLITDIAREITNINNSMNWWDKLWLD